MCKEDKFTKLKYNYTWQHDALTKLGFIKFTSPNMLILKDHANYSKFNMQQLQIIYGYLS
jgi:hypothetical protein